VLLDLHMPHRHGLAVLADLRAAAPPDEYRPVLVLTADVTGEAKEYALALGARDFVTKPFDAGEVLLRVENLLEARVLHVAERRARERAERAEARASLLAEWSGRLAATLDPATAAAQLAPLVVPRWAAACEVRLGDLVVGGAPDGALAPRLAAPVVTGDGAVGRVLLAGAGGGPCAADQPLVDELALRLGMAAEHARLLAAAELATGERERLLAVVAHDLRNPLGAVAMYAEMLASLQPDDAAADGPAEAYARGALATIHASTRTMQRLVEDLLDASSLRGGALRVRRAPAPAGAPFAEAERMLRPLAERAGVALDVAGEPGAADRVVPLDAARVGQLLSNLVGNAVAYTPPGGRVTVRYAVAPADDGRTATPGRRRAAPHGGRHGARHRRRRPAAPVHGLLARGPAHPARGGARALDRARHRGGARRGAGRRLAAGRGDHLHLHAPARRRGAAAARGLTPCPTP
jgi:signal transduction histidine kinase